MDSYLRIRSIRYGPGQVNPVTHSGNSAKGVDQGPIRTTDGATVGVKGISRFIKGRRAFSWPDHS